MTAGRACQVCIRECPPGQSFCGRRDGTGRLVVRNRICALAVDSLFDKPIRNFAGDARILSLGSWGCNFRCRGCQNHRLSWTTSGEGLESIEMDPEAVVGLALERGCAGVAATFNEPAVLIEDVEDLAAAARRAGLFSVFVTNSTLTIPSVRRIAPWLDAVAADIKSLEDDFYDRYCGAGGIEHPAGKVLACVKAFRQAGCHVEVRTNVVPGGNDRESDLRGIARWINENLGAETPWHITRFFPAHELAHVSPTPARTLREARRTGLAEGLKHVYAYPSKSCDCAGEAAMIGLGVPEARTAASTCKCCGY